MTKEKQKKIVSEPVKEAPKELSADELRSQIEALQSKLNVIEPPPLLNARERQKQRIEEERIRESKLVRGQFRFDEVPGGVMKDVPFRKYPGDPILRKTFVDGEIYEIPLWMAKHLNDCSYPIHAHKQNKDGRPSINIGRKVQRCSFRAVGFIDTSNPDSLATMGPSTLVNVEIK